MFDPMPAFPAGISSEHPRWCAVVPYFHTYNFPPLPSPANNKREIKRRKGEIKRDNRANKMETIAASDNSIQDTKQSTDLRSSCTECQRSKRRCEGQRPACSRCIQRKIQNLCFYDVNKRKLKGNQRRQSHAAANGAFKKPKNDSDNVWEHYSDNSDNYVVEHRVTTPSVTLSAALNTSSQSSTPTMPMSALPLPAQMIQLPTGTTHLPAQLLPLENSHISYLTQPTPFPQLEDEFYGNYSSKENLEVVKGLSIVFDSTNTDTLSCLAAWPPYARLADALRSRTNFAPLENHLDPINVTVAISFIKNCYMRMTSLRSICLKEAAAWIVSNGVQLGKENSLNTKPQPSTPIDMWKRLQTSHAEPTSVAGLTPLIIGSHHSRQLILLHYFIVSVSLHVLDTWQTRAVCFKTSKLMQELGLCNCNMPIGQGWLPLDEVMVNSTWTISFSLDLIMSGTSLRLPFTFGNTAPNALSPFRTPRHLVKRGETFAEKLDISELWKIVGHVMTLRINGFPGFENERKSNDDPNHPLSDHNWVRNLLIGMIESWKQNQPASVSTFVDLSLEDSVDHFAGLMFVLKSLGHDVSLQIDHPGGEASSLATKILYAAMLFHYINFTLYFVSEPGIHTASSQDMAWLLDVEGRSNLVTPEQQRRQHAEVLELFVEQQQRQGLDAAVNLLALAKARIPSVVTAANAGEVPFWAAQWHQGTHMGTNRVNTAILHLHAMSRLLDVCLRTDLEFSIARMRLSTRLGHEPPSLNKSFVTNDVFFRYCLVFLPICEANLIVGLLRTNPDEWALKVDLVHAPDDVYPLRHHLVLQARGSGPTQAAFDALNTMVGRLERHLDALAQFSRAIPCLKFETCRLMILDILNGSRDWLPFEVCGMEWLRIDAVHNRANGLAVLNAELDSFLQ